MDAILTRKGTPIVKNFSANQYELLADYTVSGSAISSYTFSGLNITSDDEVVFVSDITNQNNTSFLYLYVNGNTTTTNYNSQQIEATGTNVSGVRTNDTRAIVSIPNYKTYAMINIKLTNNGYLVFQSHTNYKYGSEIGIVEHFGTSTFTLSSIKSLTLTSSVASAIGIGSRFQLYRVKGQVQQTWATT